jgi:predicted aconitase with swiveling domain
MKALTLCPGEAEGAPLLLEEPLSFWGGLDVTTGLIIDRWHPQVGQCVAGRVLMMASGRGSSSGSAALAEALRLGVGSAAILLLRRDGIVIVGALVAMELYGLSCPVALVAPRDWQNIAAADRLKVHAMAGGAEVTLSNPALNPPG